MGRKNNICYPGQQSILIDFTNVYKFNIQGDRNLFFLSPFQLCCMLICDKIHISFFKNNSIFSYIGGIWTMKKRRIVIALGHDALGTTLPEQKKAAKEAAKAIILTPI